MKTHKMIISNALSKSSFRDPSGFVFSRGGKILRQVNKSYANKYDLLMNSGLYEILVKDQRLIPHKESDEAASIPEISYKVLEPDVIPFISYPYEWSFSMRKAAALQTLAIQKKALEHNMILKDASAFNIQFLGYQPILIDTLSFNKYEEGQPWDAYGQFCRHFLAPLALMAYTDIRLGQWMRIDLEGTPLDLAAKLLPVHTRANPGLLIHIHLHAHAQQRYSTRKLSTQFQIDRNGLMGLIESLDRTIDKLQWNPRGTVWGNYYENTNYSIEAITKKEQLVSGWLELVRPKHVWDLGANDGRFSRLACARGINTISMDVDPAAVEKNYLITKTKRFSNLLPLIIDITNPSPAIGWDNQERSAITERHLEPGQTMVFALALIHHLAISNNIPLQLIAHFFQKLCNHLIIEFIPKSDSQVKRMLSSRLDIFEEYNQETFEYNFQRYFSILDKQRILESERWLYLMARK